MKNKNFCLVLLSLTFNVLGGSAFGQLPLTDPGAKRMCAAVKDVQLPANDQPSSDERKALANCVSQDFYFGFGQPADVVKARKCAYVEWSNDRIRNALQAIECLTYASDQSLTRGVREAVEMIDAALRGVVTQSSGNFVANYPKKHAAKAASRQGGKPPGNVENISA